MECFFDRFGLSRGLMLCYVLSETLDPELQEAVDVLGVESGVVSLCCSFIMLLYKI